MPTNLYAAGAGYELFMTKAYGLSEPGSRNELHGQTMINLINAEQGTAYSSHLDNAPKQLKAIKGHIAKAIDNYLKQDLNPEQQSELKRLKALSEQAQLSVDLLSVIDAGLDVVSGPLPDDFA